MTEFAIPAIKYDRKIGVDGVEWIILPDLGRGEGCMGIDKVTAPSAEINIPSPTLEYDFTVDEADSVRIALGILPTQDINPERGLRLAVKVDGGESQPIDARRGLVDTFYEYTPANLSNSKKLKPLPKPGKMALNGYGRGMRNEVFDNIRWLEAVFPIKNSDKHTLIIKMMDPEIVIERIVINPDDSRYSYFGPPEK